MDAFGELREIKFESGAHGNPKMIGVPTTSVKNGILDKGKKLCPICSAPFGKKEFYCDSCGVKLG